MKTLLGTSDKHMSRQPNDNGRTYDTKANPRTRYTPTKKSLMNPITPWTTEIQSTSAYDGTTVKETIAPYIIKPNNRTIFQTERLDADGSGSTAPSTTATNIYGTKGTAHTFHVTRTAATLLCASY